MLENKTKVRFPEKPNLADEILPNLWLGDQSAALNLKLLEDKNIRFILTVEVLPIKIYDSEYRRLNIEKKHVRAYDISDQDLLSHFDETYEFIEKGLESNAVLVHCLYGVSRSATIILAYLMKKKHWKVKSAFEYVNSKRFIKPNPSFMGQLKVFEKMNFKVNKNNTQYKMFRLCIATKKMMKFKEIPKSFADVIKTDPSLEVAKPDPRVFKCKKCRRVVAQITNLLPHSPDKICSWKDEKWSEEKNEICSEIYFIEPLSWMENVSTFFEGKLYCPNSSCKSKLGSFSWIPGSRCPCGAFVSPAFYLVPSKVDGGNYIRCIQKR